MIKHDGTAEFNSIIARGHIEALSGFFHGRIEADEGFFKGDLHAQFINISGEVVAGINYVIRSNNTIVERPQNTVAGYAKEIITAARGTVTVRVRLTKISGTPNNVCTIGIIVNNSGFAIPTFTASANVYYERDITLPNEVNSIILYFHTQTLSTNSIVEFETFEIRCQYNPRFLRLLG